MSFRVLVVDDDRFFVESVTSYLQADDLLIDGAYSLAEARTKLTQRYDLLIVDYELPDGLGPALVAEARTWVETARVLLVTGRPALENAVEALRAGIDDYLSKPIDLEALRLAVLRSIRGIEESRIASVERYRRAQLTHRPPPAPYSASPTDELAKWIDRASRTTSPVLIQGESGTGKTRLAEQLHASGPRSRGAFLSLNCSALPESLLESELFGHERGAFTGATSARLGLFELASSGTLFLDEVAELSPAAQARLLSVIESGTLRRVGGVQDRQVDVRVVAATNANLAEQVARGRFRHDLRYRLEVIVVRLPPLRERLDELPGLVAYWLAALSAPPGLMLHEGEIAALCEHPWPGNVRELRTVLERALLMHDEGPLRPSAFLDGGLSSTRVAAAGSCSPIDDLTLSALERRRILEVVDQPGASKEAAAQKLGISVATLRRKLRELGRGRGAPRVSTTPLSALGSRRKFRTRKAEAQFERSKRDLCRRVASTMSANAAQSGHPAVGLPRASPWDVSRRSVLVVDDEPLFRQMVVDAITEWVSDVDAYGAGDGREALTCLDERHIDVIVTDLQMPRMDGVTFLWEVLNRAVPAAVIVMTAHATPQLERWATSRLAFQIFEKPVDLPELLATIDRLMVPAEVGHLEGVTLPGLCQLLQLERKTCEVRVRSGERAGRLLFREGVLIDAVHDDADGNIAAMDILTWLAPTVEMSGRTPAHAPHRVTEDMTFLLMEAVRLLDDRARPSQRGADVQSLRAAAQQRRSNFPQGMAGVGGPTRAGVGLGPVALDHALGAVHPAATELPVPESSSSSSSLPPPVIVARIAQPNAGPSDRHPPMASISDSVKKLSALDGFVATALVDSDSGMVLGAEGAERMNLEVAAALNSEVLRTKRKAITTLELNDGIEDILITLGKQYHLIRPMRERPTVFFYLVLERSRANLALARMGLADVERSIAF